MVVDDGREAVAQAVPDVPEEGAVAEELAVIAEELVAQPRLQRHTRVAALGQEALEGASAPVFLNSCVQT